jgi:hypothetical protein
MIKIFVGLHVKYLLFLLDFNETLFFFDRFSKHTEISNFMIILSMLAELFRADRKTDRHDEVNIRFSHFANPSNNVSSQVRVTVRFILYQVYQKFKNILM